MHGDSIATNTQHLARVPRCTPTNPNRASEVTIPPLPAGLGGLTPDSSADLPVGGRRHQPSNHDPLACRGPGGHGSSNDVEALRRYSNRPDLLGLLLDVLRTIEERDRQDEPGVSSTGCGGGSAPVRDRLSEADVREIIDRFRAGTPKHRLAAQYGVSLSTLKRLLRRYL